MPPKDERLRTIQTEIDRCVNEMGGLGCLGSGWDEMEDTRRVRPPTYGNERRVQNKARDGTQARKDTLEAVIHEVQSMRISENAPLVRALLDRVKPMLVDLMEQIKQMDFTDNGEWGELSRELDTLCKTLYVLALTQDKALNSLFTAIHDGVYEITQRSKRWMTITDREAVFKRIQENIGSKLIECHHKFESGLPKDIAPAIERIGNIMIGAKASVPAQTSGGGEAWKQDLEKVRLIVKDMKISRGATIMTLEKLVKPKIDTLLQTIVRYDLNKIQDTQKLYAEIKGFEAVSGFLSVHLDVEPLFTAIVRGISTTMPPIDSWAQFSLKQRKDAFIACLHGIGTEICNANEAIMDSALHPIAGRIYRVGGILRNISSGD
jgi:hypothetical protein